MRILVVFAHYFGPSHPENSLPAIGSYIEPLGRIAALNEAIVALHRGFGPHRHYCDGAPIDADTTERCLDIVVLAVRGHELTGAIGLAPGTIEVRYVDCKPPWIAFEAQEVFRERRGRYDFYCFMEDDLVIHDPAFFDKLTWFGRCFGERALLMPVRCEVPATGTPAKVITDLDLPPKLYAPFRRSGQAERLAGDWNGRQQTFELSRNPHAACFFLSRAQLDHWIAQPTYGDHDDSWIGPLESAVTFSIGRVFDLYKPAGPDPFFLEIQHLGVRYSASSPPAGRRYGEPPLLAIAQNALRAALESEPGRVAATSGSADPAFVDMVRHWLAQGTAVELRGQMDRLEARISEADAHARELAAWAKNLDSELVQRTAERDRLMRDAGELWEHHRALAAHAAGLEQHLRATQDQTAAMQRSSEETAAMMLDLERQLIHERHRQDVHSRSLRWLLGTMRVEIRRRLRGRRGG